MSRHNTNGIEQEIFQEFVNFFHGRLEKELVMLKKGEALQHLKESIISAQIVLKSDDTDGVLVMRTNKGFLWQTHPERKYGEELTDEDFLDWAGEIVNRILGGLKNGLLARNISTTLQPPFAKFGEIELDVDSELFEVVPLEIGNQDFAMEVKFAIRQELGTGENDGNKKVSA